MDFGAINEAVANNGNHTMLALGMGMLAVGLLFKVGAAPFQAWVPDVYQGAPTAVTAFMAAATKVAAFGALLRLFYVAFGSARWAWQPMMWVIAILTMIVGTVLALVQSDMKRMLAYSSVAHTGFLLTGVLGLQSAATLGPDQLTSLQAVLFYLVTYGFTTLGAFAVVSLVRDSAGEQSTISRWAGLGKHSPVVAGVFSLFLLGMAGIPLTSGFTAKWAVFEVALSAGAWPVVAFFYVRVIVVMYFHEPDSESAYVAHPSVLTATAIGVSAAATLALGLVPGPVLDLAQNAGQFIR
jgi:NADH-quinone oxidoreductase subunit N